MCTSPGVLALIWRTYKHVNIWFHHLLIVTELVDGLNRKIPNLLANTLLRQKKNTEGLIVYILNNSRKLAMMFRLRKFNTDAYQSLSWLRVINFLWALEMQWSPPPPHTHTHTIPGVKLVPCSWASIISGADRAQYTRQYTGRPAQVHFRQRFMDWDFRNDQISVIPGTQYVT